MDPQLPLVWCLQKQVRGSVTLGDLMAHSIDLARFLVGEITEVSGMTETFVKKRPLGELSGGPHAGRSGNEWGDVDVDDSAAVLAHFDQGAGNRN